MLLAHRFALDPTPRQARVLGSHCGGARFAFNWGLARISAVLAQRDAERSYGIPEVELTPSLGWSLAALRREWNRAKYTVAPWWAENSKESSNSGLDALARALTNWADSRSGKRKGATVGFPGSKPAAGRGCRVGSPPGRSGSRAGPMWCCPGSGGSIPTRPPPPY